MTDLSISVIVPVYNGARFLDRCLESIHRQRYEPLEIVVVDDGSTDETPDAIARLVGQRVRSVRQPNAGPAAARNHGLRIAGGTLIAFLDVDDTWPERKLVAQAAHLRDHPAVEIVQGRIREDARAPYFNVNLGALLFRRSVFDVTGGFDETLRFGEDVDLLIRAWENGIAKSTTGEVALDYHKHDTNMTNGIDRQRIFTTLFKRHLDRRRAGRAAPPERPTIGEYLGWARNPAVDADA